LRAARLRSGLKQSDVAARTGLPQQYLSLIEAGQQNITLKTMILLAEVVDHDLLNMLRRALDDPPID
jgi:transcriptional regulator with XRE-family HTH domain